MSTAESCCDVQRRTGKYLTSDGHQLDWEQNYCLSCGAGAMSILEGGLLLSFTTTGRKCGSSVDHGAVLPGAQILALRSRPTPSDTPEQPGSCKPASTPGKLPATSE